MSSTQGAQYKAAYKKALSALNQMVTLNVALDDYDFSQTAAAGGTATNEANLYNIVKNRMNVVKTGTTSGYKISTNSAENAGSDINVGSGTNYTFYFNDGITFSFESTAGACVDTTAGRCKGWIDVNGQKNPNKIVKCTTGSGDTCQVTNPTDVYPVIFYDQTLLPNSAAGRAVLYGK
jgi:hypothetical protein